ncbi:MAG: hypothetical protein GXO74_14260 [Calditrichaeota bacterium]|nr:hypothetical protein [Calditrichota bacterium]
MKNAMSFFLIIVVVGLLLVSCNENPTSFSNDETITNVPVIANALDAFAFTLNADNFSINRMDSLTFDADSLVISLILTNYHGGNGKITIFTSDSVQIFSELLNSNKINAKTNIAGHIPKSIIIAASNLTGSISFALAKQN